MPKRTPRQVLRAMITAARMTLRGQPHPNEAARTRYPKLYAWIEAGMADLRAVEQAAQQEGVDMVGFRLHIEGRDVSLRLLVDGVRFHLEKEYPSLLASGNPHTLLGIRGMTLDDHHAASRLAGAEALPPATRAALAQLVGTLARQPSDT